MEYPSFSESNIIQKIQEMFAANPQDMGDDCAVLPFDDETSLLLATDALIEDVHFLRDMVDARDVGYKLVAVNVSDICAMGGEPTSMLLTASFPPNISKDWIDDFLKGVREGAVRYQVKLVGGDTTGAPGKIYANIAILGKIETAHIKYRHGAKPGDILCLTGDVGRSKAGLHCLLNKLIDPGLVGRHMHPDIPVQPARWLAANPNVTAMMDVSDGLNIDLHKLCDASGIGARIDVAHIPQNTHFRNFCADHGLNPLTTALTSGEEYCLLLCINPSVVDQIAKEYEMEFSLPLYQIGTVTEEKKVCYIQDNKPVSLELEDYDHFRQAS